MHINIISCLQFFIDQRFPQLQEIHICIIILHTKPLYRFRACALQYLPTVVENKPLGSNEKLKLTKPLCVYLYKYTTLMELLKCSTIIYYVYTINNYPQLRTYARIIQETTIYGTPAKYTIYNVQVTYYKGKD